MRGFGSPESEDGPVDWGFGAPEPAEVPNGEEWGFGSPEPDSNVVVLVGLEGRQLHDDGGAVVGLRAAWNSGEAFRVHLVHHTTRVLYPPGQVGVMATVEFDQFNQIKRRSDARQLTPKVRRARVGGSAGFYPEVRFIAPACPPGRYTVRLSWANGEQSEAIGQVQVYPRTRTRAQYRARVPIPPRTDAGARAAELEEALT